MSRSQKRTNKVLSLLVFLLASLIEDAKSMKKVYCSSLRNEQYVPIIDLCMKCDKCSPGWELESFEFIQFEITPDHGALGCRRCVRCQDGFYNSKRSYGKCIPCRDCKAYGKRTTRNCTVTSNAKCGQNVKLVPESIKNVSESYVPLANSTKQKNDSPVFFRDLFGYKRKVFIVLISCSVAIVMFSQIVVCLFFQNCPGGKYIGINGKGFPIENVAQDDNSNRNNDGMDIIHTAEIVPCLPVHGYNYVIPEENDKLTDKQLMFIGKRIAANGYLELLLELNVPEIDIRIIEEENKSSCVTRSYRLLKKWVELLPEKATISNLLMTLDRVQRHDVVHDFLREFNKTSEICTV